MKTIRIIPIPQLSWKVRLATFLSIFGIVWLFVDPLSTFGIGLSSLSTWGIWGYLSLIVIAAFVTFLIEYLRHSYLVGKMSFLLLTVILSETGTRHVVEVPQDLSVTRFLELFLDNVAINTVQSPLLSNRNLYETSLFVKRAENFEKVPSQLTLSEAGLLSGDICKIKGEILPEYSSVNFNRNKG